MGPEELACMGKLVQLGLAGWSGYIHYSGRWRGLDFGTPVKPETRKNTTRECGVFFGMAANKLVLQLSS